MQCILRAAPLEECCFGMLSSILRFPLLMIVLIITIPTSAFAQEERYYRCDFKDAAQASRNRPDGSFTWRHPISLDEEVTVSVFGGEAYLAFKTFEVEGEVIAGDMEDPFINELIVHGQGTFASNFTVQNTSITIVISDFPGGVSAALNYISQSTKKENLTIATGVCDKIFH